MPGIPFTPESAREAARRARERRGARPLVERFWSKVFKGGPGGCWLWAGSVKPNGYGIISAGPRGSSPLQAHRVAFALHFGEAGEGLVIHHRCLNRRCVNPDHLEAVTYSVNNAEQGRYGYKGGGQFPRQLAFAEAGE
jgi:HNH endonuclease